MIGGKFLGSLKQRTWSPFEDHGHASPTHHNVSEIFICTMSSAETKMSLCYTLCKHITEKLKDLLQVPLPCIFSGALEHRKAKTAFVLADKIDKIFAPRPCGPAQLTSMQLSPTLRWSHIVPLSYMGMVWEGTRRVGLSMGLLWPLPCVS